MLLTVDEAADFLNVPKQYLHRLLDSGEVPYVLVGTDHRIPLDGLIRYRERRDALRREKLLEITRISEEIGMYDG